MQKYKILMGDEIIMENGKLGVGKNIAELRKQKGITQETLAEAVGVSGQAVSKWESGGCPDIELLQPIADYFGVSIDRLFGREIMNFADLEQKVGEYLCKISDDDERMRKAFELCWAIEFANSGMGSDVPAIEKTYGRQYSQVLLDCGMTSLGMQDDLRYFFAAPQPEEGWGKILHYKDAYKDMLALLGDEDTLKALFFLYSRKGSDSWPPKSFTPKILEKHVGVTAEKATAILEDLKRYEIIYTSEIELDDEVKMVYNFNANSAFVPFLIFLDELAQKPNSWICYRQNRHIPYL